MCGVQAGRVFNYDYGTLRISKVRFVQCWTTLRLPMFGERLVAIHFANVRWYNVMFNALEGLVRAEFVKPLFL